MISESFLSISDYLKNNHVVCKKKKEENTKKDSDKLIYEYIDTYYNVKIHNEFLYIRDYIKEPEGAMDNIPVVQENKKCQNIFQRMFPKLCGGSSSKN